MQAIPLPADSRPDLFISHCSADRVAQEFVSLIRGALYADKEAEFVEKVFFTSYKENGLHVGDGFDKIIKKLEEARLVIGLVTRGTLASTAMIAEMSLARHYGKLLPVLARKSYMPLLKWPFEQVQSAALDIEDDLLALLRHLARELGRPFKETTAVKEQCARMVQVAKGYCPDTIPPERRWQWRARGLAAATLVFVPAAFFLGRMSMLPAIRHVALGSTETQVGDVPVRLLYSGTFPEKYLSRRLTEIQDALQKNAQNDPRISSASAVRNHFLRALELAAASPSAKWTLQASDLNSLRRHVDSWDGVPDRQGCFGRPNEQPGCINMGWSNAVREALADKVKSFDDTKFAIALIDNKPAVLVKGVSPPEQCGWKVETVDDDSVDIALR